ncbi:glycosyltransferase family 39 protein [Marinobacteraceae bacterium S3BR75-40.1]
MVVLILIASGWLLLAGLSDVPASKATESRVAGIAAEMYLDADYVVPRLNGSPFLEKPPLYSWLTAVVYHFLGISNLSARLVSVLSAIGILLVLGGFQRTQLKRPITDTLYTLFILATMVSFWSAARTSSQDMLLAFGVTLSLLNAYRFLRHNDLKCLFLAGLGMGIAALSKGIFGVSMILMPLVAYALVERLSSERPSGYRAYGILLLGFTLGGVPLLLWLAMLYGEAGWSALYDVVWTNSFGRFQGASGGHVVPWYYYLVRVPALFQPWFFLVVLGVASCLRAKRRSSFDVFLLCWLIVPIALLSLSSSKRTIYLLSLYPAAALVVGRVFYSLRQGAWGARGIRYAAIFQWVLAALLGGYVLYELAVFRASWLPWMVAICAVAVLWFAYQVRYPYDLRRSLMTNLLVVYTLLVFYGSFLNSVSNQDRSFQNLFKDRAVFAGSSLRDLVVNEGFAPALYRPPERLSGAVVFYLHRTIPELNSPEELNAFFQQHHKYLVISEDNELLAFGDHTKSANLSRETVYMTSSYGQHSPNAGTASSIGGRAAPGVTDESTQLHSPQDVAQPNEEDLAALPAHPA